MTLPQIMAYIGIPLQDGNLELANATPGKLILSSINEAYPPLEVDTRGNLEHSVRIIGRCVWSCREL